MIRLLRGVSIAALVAAILLFAAAQVNERMNQDDTLPTITADSDTLEVPCAYTTDQLLAGVTASDVKDGDLTSQVLVGNFTRFIDPGVCDLNYVVFDSSEHMATLTRRIHFTDYHSPRFQLSEPLVFAESTTNNTDVRALFSAYDVLDGDLTDWITYVETDAAYNNPGDYTITMEVRNSFGDTVSYAFPIHIYERNTQDFDITLTEPLVYVEQGGRNLSGGQKQRLTLARALLKKAPVLIMDDSASALDYATDARLRTAIANLKHQPTVFIVAQRASSLMHADKIIVLDDGKIAGMGSHEQLLATCSIYREIYETQFKKEA